MRRTVRVFSMVLLAAIGALLCFKSVHWPLFGDSAVLHYGVFLFSLGRRPYSQYIEPDLPGAYVHEALAMRVFGSGDMAWHVYDLALLAVIVMACIAIAKPYDWLAGLCAGVFFSALHLAEGPQNAGQREEIITACLLCALAFLFFANRQRQPWWMLAFGFCIGWGTAIKPVLAPLGVVFLIALAVALRRDRTAQSRYWWAALAGFFLALLPSVWFLWHYEAFQAFLLNTRVLLPYYVGLAKSSIPELLRAIPKKLLLVLAFGGVLSYAQRRRSPEERWEWLLFFVAMAWGLFSYLVQRKEFNHHLYEVWAIALLFFFLEAFRALRERPLVAGAGLLAILFGFALMSSYGRIVYQQPYTDARTNALMADLNQLGGTSLNDRLQCLDLYKFCPSALYHMRLAETFATGNDMAVLPSPGDRGVPYFQERLWADLQQNPPAVIVVTNDQFMHVNGFEKMEQWPQFAEYVRANYRLYTTRMFGPDGYRVYLRRAAPGVEGAGTKLH